MFEPISKAKYKTTRACSTQPLLRLACLAFVQILAQSTIAANEVFSAMPQGGGVMSAPKNFTPAPANAVAAPGAMDMAGGWGTQTAETKLFEKLDSIVFSGYPTPNEKIILSKSFNQEAERVQQWQTTAQTVALKYRQAAKALRNLPVPANWTEFDQYREARADWFDDAALVYEDMIRPRKPAKTIEELNAQLAAVQDRAKVLADSKQANREMDRDLRRKYHIHAPKQTDALTKYVTGGLQK
jgi:hypothetical protein